METGLLLLLLALTLAAIVEEKTRFVPILLVCLALCRVEMGALIPVAAWYLYKRNKLPGALAISTAVIPVLVCVFLNYHFYGHVLPNSSTAKLDQAISHYWGRWPTGFLHVFTLPQYSPGAPYTVPFLFIFGLIGFFGMRESKWYQLLLPFALITLSFYVLLNIPPYPWYYAPYIFLLGLFAVVPFRQGRLATFGPYILAGLICLQAVTTFRAVPTPLSRYDQYVAVTNWINQHSSPGASIEACEIGAVGWNTDHRVIDILGLTDPKNSKHIRYRDVTSWIAEDKPDFIIIHKPAWVWEAIAAQDPNYALAPVSSGDVYVLRRKKQAN